MKAKTFKKNFLHFCLPVLLLLIGFLSPSLAFKSSYATNNEIIALMIASEAKRSSTKSLNVNIVSNKDDTTLSELNGISSSIFRLNFQKTAGDLYAFRMIFSSDAAFNIDIKDVNDNPITMLGHYSSGKPHENKLGEYIHSNFALKMMFSASEGYYENPNSTSNICLRKSTVDKMIKIDSPSKDDYLNFIKNNQFYVKYAYDGKTETIPYTISNIIEEKYDDYFYSETFGEYITINSYYKDFLPNYNHFSVNFDFGSSIFDSSQYIKYIRETFPFESYKYSINNRNISNPDFTNQEKIISLLQSNHILNDSTATTISIAVVLLIILAIFALSSYQIKRLSFSLLRNELLVVVTYVFQYGIMFFLSKISPQFLPLFSVMGNMYGIFLLLGALLAIFLAYKLHEKDGQFDCYIDCCEVSI